MNERGPPRRKGGRGVGEMPYRVDCGGTVLVAGTYCRKGTFSHTDSVHPVHTVQLCMSSGRPGRGIGRVIGLRENERCTLPIIVIDPSKAITRRSHTAREGKRWA
jgi:hypothetical protein